MIRVRALEKANPSQCLWSCAIRSWCIEEIHEPGYLCQHPIPPDPIACVKNGCSCKTPYSTTPDQTAQLADEARALLDAHALYISTLPWDGNPIHSSKPFGKGTSPMRR